jgi:iron complex outermembrane receptor protein
MKSTIPKRFVNHACSCRLSRKVLATVIGSFIGLANVSAQESGGMFALEEVVVTAQKRSEDLQDVPIAISAFTGDSMKVRGMTNIAQVGDFTPNVEIDTTSSFSGSTQVLTAYIRGIGQNDFAFNLDPGVGVYVDGVY